jgi:hypothetical protein
MCYGVFYQKPALAKTSFMKKINILLLAASLVSAISVNAQKRDSTKMHNWFQHDIAGAMQIQVTYRKADISQLNQALNANGLHSISPNNIWINASMAHMNHNWITEDGIGFSPEATSSNNGLDAKYSQYQLYFRLGYNVSSSSDFKLYPFLGANFSAAVLDIQDHTGIQSTNSFSGELLNSTASKTFYQPNFGIELGAGFDFLAKVKPKVTDCFTIERSIPIGIRAGYYLNTYASQWKIDNYGLQGSNQKQSAAFISFNIGLGYEIKKH